MNDSHSGSKSKLKKIHFKSQQDLFLVFLVVRPLPNLRDFINDVQIFLDVFTEFLG